MGESDYYKSCGDCDGTGQGTGRYLDGSPSECSRCAGRGIVYLKMPEIDQGQRTLNDGSYCFHEENGRYCGRAEWWAGHGVYHRFASERAEPNQCREDNCNG